jgi:hypothetical protein
MFKWLGPPPLPVEAVNAVLRLFRRFRDMRALPPLHLSEPSPRGRTLSVDSAGFWATLSGAGPSFDWTNYFDSSNTGHRAYGLNGETGLAGKNVWLYPGAGADATHLPDWRFEYCRQPVGVTGPPCDTQLCYSVVDRCGRPFDGVSVTITGPGGFTASGTTNASGQFCTEITQPGTYTATATVAGYTQAGTCTVTMTAPCSRTSFAGAGCVLDPDEVGDPPGGPGTWVYVQCCACVRTGRQPFKIPRSLFVALTGPVEVVGSLGSIALDFTGGVGFGAGYDQPPTATPWSLTWDSGCLGPSGAFGQCYLPGAYCGGVVMYATGAAIPYQSCRAVLTIGQDPAIDGGRCYVNFSFRNYWNAGCAAYDPPPDCGSTAFGPGIAAGAPWCPLPPADPVLCGPTTPPDATFYNTTPADMEGGVYPMVSNMLHTYPTEGPYPLCGPVSATLLAPQICCFGHTSSGHCYTVEAAFNE